MVSETWYSEIESTILTHLQYRLTERFDAPYPALNCTTSSQTESVEDVKDFPTLYVHMLSPVEAGNDLTNATVNAVNATFDLQVFSDKSEDECRKIITTVIQEMKSLHFSVPMFPDPQTSNKKYFAITRMSRIIASGDSELVPQEETS